VVWSVANTSWRLEVVGDGLQRAMDETGLAFTPATPEDGSRKQLRHLVSAKYQRLLVEPPGEHYANIAQFDIGIAPLSDTPFSRARSAIKVLEYAALGIPAVATPLPEYVGWLGSGYANWLPTPNDWVRCLKDFQNYFI